MSNLLSPADKQIMVSSFLEVAVGQTVDTAHQFLQVGHWRIEDALQLFYVGLEGQLATSSSCVSQVEYMPSGGHSQREKNVCVQLSEHDSTTMDQNTPVCVDETTIGVTLAPITDRLMLGPHTSESYGIAPSASAPASLVPHRHDLSHIQMVSVASEITRLEPPKVAKRRQKRTRAEMAAAALSTTSRRPSRRHVQMAAGASTSNTATAPPAYTPPATRQPKRTPAQIATTAPSLRDDFITATPGGNVSNGWRFSHVQDFSNGNSPALLVPDLLLLTPAIARATTCGRGRIPVENPTSVTACVESDCVVPRRPRRTQIEMTIDANTPALYKRRAARIPKVRVHVCKGLGIHTFHCYS